MSPSIASLGTAQQDSKPIRKSTPKIGKTVAKTSPRIGSAVSSLPIKKFLPKKCSVKVPMLAIPKDSLEYAFRVGPSTVAQKFKCHQYCSFSTNFQEVLENHKEFCCSSSNFSKFQCHLCPFQSHATRVIRKHIERDHFYYKNKKEQEIKGFEETEEQKSLGFYYRDRLREVANSWLSNHPKVIEKILANQGIDEEVEEEKVDIDMEGGEVDEVGGEEKERSTAII